MKTLYLALCWKIRCLHLGDRLDSILLHAGCRIRGNAGREKLFRQGYRGTEVRLGIGR